MTMIDEADVIDSDTHVDDDAESTGRLIRPYAITGGRTGGEVEIGLESHIQASTRPPQGLDAYRWEAAQLVDLVQTPMALVEIAARLELPLGVTRVLVADLIADGAVVLHQPVSTRDYGGLLERVLDGVRKL